ncbi:MAG: BolA/IbaG family iron-sulfur metabolism protein [Gammaproteobacteria bacterium]|nr:BolA/IbaG family iron-sulfur metabolism protein [Gammaproteobacteria bacterium]
MTIDEIIARVRPAFPQAEIKTSGEACNVELSLTDDSFVGEGLLQRQKRVLALFSKEIASGELHALSIKAKTHSENANSSLLMPK